MFRTTLAVAVALASAGVIAPAVGHAADNTTQPAAEPEYTGRIVVRYEKGTDAAERDDLEEHAAREHGVDLEQAPAVDAHTDVLDAADPDKVEAVADEIAADPAVVSAEPAIRFRPTAVTPNDPYFPQQWNLGPNPGANVQAAWPTSTGAGQTAAVIDSGITCHPDLTGRLVSGYDFISDTNYSNDGTGPDADPSDPGDWTTSGECGSTVRPRSPPGTAPTSPASSPPPPRTAWVSPEPHSAPRCNPSAPSGHAAAPLTTPPRRSSGHRAPPSPGPRSTPPRHP